MDDFVIARNPEPGSSLPYLLRLPLASGAVVLKARDTWSRTAKIYCHPSDAWPAEPDVVERVAVRRCERRGAAIDLVLDRGREHRSQFVFARARGRDVVFWQSQRTARQARPAVAVPTARASGQVLDIAVDVHERYPWTFAKQQATTHRAPLPAGDYAVADAAGRVVATIERKSLADLVSTLVSGRLTYLLADLATVDRAALVVEDRWSGVFKLEHVRPSVVADGLAEAQVRFPTVPILFAETRPLAEELAYRFLGAARVHALEAAGAHARLDELAATPTPPALAPRPPTTAQIRAWALDAGLAVADRGRLRPEVLAAFAAAQATGSDDPHP